VAGCSDGGDQPVVVADEGTNERLNQMSRRLQELEADIRVNIVGTREAEDLRDRVADLERELADLKEGGGAGASAGTSATAPPATGASTSPGERPAAEPYVPPAPDSGSTGVYSEEQIASFRKLQEEVDRRKDAEQRAERVRRQLGRAQVSLSEEETKAVIDRTIAHENEVRTLLRGGFGRTDEERADVQKKIEDLRGIYERDLRSIVRSDSADKVIETLGRANPGILRRVGDRTTRQR
jgi:hypothetical protein